jgi:hypothetical protein
MDRLQSIRLGVHNFRSNYFSDLSSTATIDEVGFGMGDFGGSELLHTNCVTRVSLYARKMQIAGPGN